MMYVKVEILPARFDDNEHGEVYDDKDGIGVYFNIPVVYTACFAYLAKSKVGKDSYKYDDDYDCGR